MQPGDPGLPTHVAIIMDGNGRWARKRNLPRTAGHEAGLQVAREITQECVRLGIKYLTLYAFSTENWKRPKQEVSFLMNLFYQSLQQVATELHNEDVRIRFIGNKDQLPAKLTALITEVEARTAQNKKLTLNLAINYGGRSEIIRAVRELVKKAQKEGLAPETITEEQFARFLFTTDQPDPDLLIRTSGEQRISNFMLWQTAYTELYFTSTLWPDFSPAEFRAALAAYKTRSRRFGGIKEGRTK
ncbi:isoprenyl transferase [Capillibacterium thermochitinicola]